ncbi:hypothetical protein QZH41_000695 [Actinostola sp. cb2023]|nr:hypothetical protein QZH41_000695 [Actinostola sp. cb2023]
MWKAAGQTKHIPTVIGILTGTLCGTTLICTKETRKSSSFINGREKEHPKMISSAEVAEHDSLETGAWVSYRGNVYDITDFINSHPGGVDKILMSAGGALEPYWSAYPIHKTNTVLDLLEQYHIG